MCSRTAGCKLLYMLYGIPLPLTPCHAFRSTSGSADVLKVADCGQCLPSKIALHASSEPTGHRAIPLNKETYFSRSKTKGDVLI
jgi:hypothetical protein